MPNYKTCVKYIRDGLVEQEHEGIVLCSGKLEVESGKLNSFKTERLFNSEFNNKNSSNFQLNYPFYLRSCAKPLQASLIIDYDTDKFFGFTEEEIALCCASHAGEEIHTNIAQNILNKIGLDKSYLKCGLHKPLSKTRQNEMLLSGEKETELHNNCSGKHIMMLAICKQKGWSLLDYYKPEHQLQIAIKNKIYELCEVNNEYPITTDGCGVPIVSMPLENMLKGYLNLFCNPKYEKIKNAFLNNPYIIGGEDRTDTKIIQNSKNIVAKVGAGGLCIVINTEKQDGFVVKIIDCDMRAREFVVIEMLKKLNWADIECDKTIKTLHGQVVGRIEVEL